VAERITAARPDEFGVERTGLWAAATAPHLPAGAFCHLRKWIGGEVDIAPASYPPSHVFFGEAGFSQKRKTLGTRWRQVSLAQKQS
jgi:hypothetical protein